MYSVQGRFETNCSGNRRSHPVRQVFIDVDDHGKTTRYLVYLGPTDNDVVFRQFAEEELGVPFETCTVAKQVPISSILSM